MQPLVFEDNNRSEKDNNNNKSVIIDIQSDKGLKFHAEDEKSAVKRPTTPKKKESKREIKVVEV